MLTVDTVGKYARWLDTVHELLDHHQRLFPRAIVADLLRDTFDTAVVTWNWMESGNALGTELDRDIGWDPSAWTPERALEFTLRHPLAQWFLASRDPRPTSLGRVPRSIGTRHDHALVAEQFDGLAIRHQLSIPYRLGGHHYRTFILGRPDEDFSDADVDLARRVQPLLAVLERHVRESDELGCYRAREVGVTPRELAVLRLLAQGMTADAIAHRLAVSRRTVHNHLQHLYRKLGVADRMRAVLVSHALGLIDLGGPPALDADDSQDGGALPVDVRTGTPLGPVRAAHPRPVASPP